ncbi:FeoB-associated Cys-rich membrane protein [Ehrlichia muris]|uniref:Uncharacterized protein n=1 Tax=Ehrlichia muris AS145 TaxID=1423892 RepID=V9R8W9_9RICK|nr:FeoB-associated Cys-rich membrane protein [Ehrlichia muris]AHC39748.1 hypothetical protein EMUR_03850 [Ehrlichia muris AS145]
MPTSPNVSTSSPINATANTNELAFRITTYSLLCITALILLAITFYAIYKHKKKSGRNKGQNYTSTSDQSDDTIWTPKFFYLDDDNKLRISIRCEEYRDIREGRIPRVIE